MSAMSEESPSMTIGEVLSLINRDFPEMTISKIRFLEGEGLISPQRAKSGYRRFSGADIDQLRLVLTAQRDRYLPLRVIKDHLADGTLREVVYPEAQLEIQGLGSLETPEGTARQLPDVDPTAWFTYSELSEQSGLDRAHLDDLIENKVIESDEVGRFTGADLLVCRAYACLMSFGVTGRHMRQVRNAASRDAHLINGAVQHLKGDSRTEAVGQMLDAFSDAHYWRVMADLNRRIPSTTHRPRRTNR